MRTAKNFQITVPFMYNFRSLSNKFPTIFPTIFLFHSTSQVRLFFVEKRKSKIFGFKCYGGLKELENVSPL